MEESGLQFVRGKPLRGWLRRQGGVMRGWQRKFFVLNDKCLFCFAREDDSRLANNYYLDDYKPVELPLSPDDTDKFMFELVAERGGVESVTFCAASDAERKEWMKGLVHNKYADKGGAIFGLPLAEAMKYEHQHGRSVPYIVEACVSHLRAFGMDTEGIFRLAGRAGLLKELRTQFETGQRPDLENVDVHTVGALLKAYLRELPESLVPPDLYQRAMNCAMRYADVGEEKKGDEVALMAKMLQEDIPYDNYATLSYLCDFLNSLAANSEKTKMDAKNLALVFGPNLIRHMDNSPELLMLTADLTQHLAFMLIHHNKEILPPRPPPGPASAAPPTEAPAMRPKQLRNVATGDLLRLSQPVSLDDPSLLLPQAVSDLQGLDFTCSMEEKLTPGSQESASPPSSPFSFHSDHFSTKHSLLEYADAASTSSESSSRGNTLERGLGDDSKPVPPRRTKSKSVKQRRMNGAPASPVDPIDVQKALSSSIHPMMSPPQASGDATPKDSSSTQQEVAQNRPGHRDHPIIRPKPSVYVVVDEKGNINGEVDSKGNAVSQMKAGSRESWRDGSYRLGPHDRPEQVAGGGDADKVLPSRHDLQGQVVALKEELLRSKGRSDKLISALKDQLSDMRTKYEERISTMVKQHQSQMIDLTAKLDAEKNSRADAVERTVALQAQLYKYKMQYGDLHE